MVVTAALLMMAAGQAVDFSPPPMVPVGPGAVQPVPPPPPPPPPEPPSTGQPPPAYGTPQQPGTAQQPGTPPPPTYAPNRPQSGYPYSPYGTPQRTDEKPPVEYGLMISEALFGALTSAGVSLLAYFLLLRDFALGSQYGLFAGNSTIGWVVYLLVFAAVPLSTAQTEVALANGSRWYYSETWPSALIGLAAEAAVVGLAYLTAGQGLDPGDGVSIVKRNANELVLLIGTIGVVPLIQMAAINFFKSPRFGKPGGTSLLNYKEGQGLRAGIPAMSPVFNPSNPGVMNGMSFSVLSGRF
jgi:hypothetical protein